MTFGDEHLPNKKSDQIFETSDPGFKPFWNLVNQMDSVLDQLFNHFETDPLPNSIHVDTYETDSDVIVEVKLPGCNPNQIQLEILGNRLKILIEDSLQEELKYETHTNTKHSYSRREHIVSLPFFIPEKEVLTTFHKEVLSISIPKKDTQQKFLD